MVSWFSDRKLVLCFARPNKEDLATVRDLVAAGKVKPVIDRCYALHEWQRPSGIWSESTLAEKW